MVIIICLNNPISVARNKLIGQVVMEINLLKNIVYRVEFISCVGTLYKKLDIGARIPL